MVWLSLTVLPRLAVTAPATYDAHLTAACRHLRLTLHRQLNVEPQLAGVGNPHQGIGGCYALAGLDAQLGHDAPGACPDD